MNTETETETETEIEIPKTWYVWHDGRMRGHGRWSGPHATLTEALESARRCRQVIGETPLVERD